MNSNSRWRSTSIRIHYWPQITKNQRSSKLTFFPEDLRWEIPCSWFLHNLFYPKREKTAGVVWCCSCLLQGSCWDCTLTLTSWQHCTGSNMGSGCEALRNCIQEEMHGFHNNLQGKRSLEQLTSLILSAKTSFWHFLQSPCAFVRAHRGSSSVPSFSCLGFKISFITAFFLN